MVSSAEIMELKRIVAKNPKSLAFAWLADLLRADKKLDEALLTVNNGLEMNSSFLPGRLARGRILLEKGDLAGARADFEAVAEQDSFCSSAQKLFLETSEKLGKPPETEIYQKILGTIEPGVVVKVRVKPKTEPAGVNAALDNLLSEDDSDDDNEDTIISNLLLQTFENIFEPGKKQSAPDIMPYSPPAPKAQPAPASAPKAPPAAPNIDSLVKEQLKSKVEHVPDLTKDMDSLLASASALPPVSGALVPPSQPSPPKAPPAAPNIDSLVKEQLKSKVEHVPDLTKDMDSLLNSSSLPKTPSPPNIDDLVKEQLTPKMENLPDLTSDINSLLSSPSPPKAPSPPNIDDLVKEQLTPKMEDLPDLTGDMDSLLAADVLSASGTLAAAPSTPDIDAIIKEELSSKVDNVPDLTKDINSALASPALEPSLSASYSLNKPDNSNSIDIDALIKEQLSSKIDNAPDLTNDINSLLASSTFGSQSTTATAPSTPGAPNIDDLVKEQLSSKVEDVPDLTGDINSLLASVPAASDSGAEPELMPYVPPTQADIQLANKPTETLAELYMDQGLPHKAVGVYKELLLKDPNNKDLKAKLALAEKQM